MPATVYACPACTMMLADSTGLVLPGAPAGRMAAVYSPAFTFMYSDTAP